MEVGFVVETLEGVSPAPDNLLVRWVEAPEADDPRLEKFDELAKVELAEGVYEPFGMVGVRR